jgi:hypothetical protein
MQSSTTASHTHHRRLWILLTFTGAAIGVGFAVSGAAHADTRPVVDRAAATVGIGGTLLPGAAKNALDKTDKKLDHPTKPTKKTVKKALGLSKKNTNTPSVNGRSGDAPPGLTKRPAQTATQPGTPPHGRQATAPTTRVRATAAPSTPGTTTGSPVAGSAVPGVHTPQHPAVAAHPTPPRQPSAAQHPAGIDLHPTRLPVGHTPGVAGGNVAPTPDGIQHPDPATPASTWQPPTRWHHAIIGYTQHHASRTRSPAPPSG